jgi:hypothetical protein
MPKVPNRDAAPEREPAGEPRVKLVTIATYFQHSEALLARMRLESSGIECILIDEHLCRIDWGLAPALGGIKLQVREEDAPRAAEILHEITGMPYVVED